jgi:hypothetical protein
VLGPRADLRLRAGGCWRLRRRWFRQSPSSGSESRVVVVLAVPRPAVPIPSSEASESGRRGRHPSGCRAEVGRRRGGGAVVAAESGQARASRLRALSAERQAEADAALAAAVEKGNHGERVVADLLDVLDGAGWCVLHDRYKPGSPANIDHVVVGPPACTSSTRRTGSPSRCGWTTVACPCGAIARTRSCGRRLTAPSSSSSERSAPTLKRRPWAFSPSCRTWVFRHPSSTTACGSCSPGTSWPG